MLEKHGYNPCDLTPGLWKHEMIPVKIILTFDNFCVKYVEEEHVPHIVEVFQQY